MTLHPDAPVLTLTAADRALLLDALACYRNAVLDAIAASRRVGVEEVAALMDRHTAIGDAEDAVRKVKS